MANGTHQLNALWSLAALRQRVLDDLESLGGAAVLAARTAREIVRPPLEVRALVQQIESIGVRSMSVAFLTAVFSSMVGT